MDAAILVPRSDVCALIDSLQSAIFSVIFTKKDGTVRKMVCRRHVTKGVKGTGTNYAEKSGKYLTVFQMRGPDSGFRNVSLETLTEIRSGGKIHHVID